MHKNTRTSLQVLGGLFDLGVAASAGDGQLLEQTLTGPSATAEAAFAALLERHGPMVLRVCRAILRDEHSAMDAFQATFLVLIRKSRSLWVRESLGPWLHRVACRAARRLKADSQRRRRLELRAGQFAPTLTVTPPSGGDELARLVHEEIDRLPEPFRAAILLCDLEGRTCAEAARLLLCPVGTVASRLARGRGRLRAQLTRRGVTLLATAIAAALEQELGAAVLSSSFRDSTTRLVLRHAVSKVGLSASAPPAVSLAAAISWRMLMSEVSSVAAILACAGCVLLAGVAGLRTVAGMPRSFQENRADQRAKESETPGPAVAVPAKPAPAPQASLFLFDEREAHKNSLLATWGNMRPLVRDANGVRFQSRLAVLYKDGTAKLFRPDAKDPVVLRLRHGSPVRELGFIEQSRLLFTTSDDRVSIWDALSGALRKEIGGAVMRPLFFSSMSTCAEPGPDPVRLTTIDVAGRAVTIWDAETLAEVAVLRPEGSARMLGAGLSHDGKTLATICGDRSVTLWSMASRKRLASFYEPSPMVARCFPDDVKDLNAPVLRLNEDFWQTVAPILPAAQRPKP
jgi:RNA polymerase sigma factor (sigma-70 family)